MTYPFARISLPATVTWVDPSTHNPAPSPSTELPFTEMLYDERTRTAAKVARAVMFKIRTLRTCKRSIPSASGIGAARYRVTFRIRRDLVVFRIAMPGFVDALMLHPSMTYGSCGVPEPETTASDVPRAASPSMRTGAWAANAMTWGGIEGLPALACAGTNSNDNRIQAAKARGNTPRPPGSHSSSRAREDCGGSSFDDSDTEAAGRSHERTCTTKIRSPGGPDTYATRFASKKRAIVEGDRTTFGAGWIWAPTIVQRSRTSA